MKRFSSSAVIGPSLLIPNYFGFLLSSLKFKSDFQDSIAAIAYAVLSFRLGRALLGPAFGYCCDMFSLRDIMLLLNGISICAAIYLEYSDSYYAVLLLSFVLGALSSRYE